MVKLAVLGGGVSGIFIANELAQNTNLKIDLLEKRSQLGGLISSVKRNEINYDIGSFIFYENNSIFKTFPFIKSDFISEEIKPILITPLNNFYSFPLNLKNYIKENGIVNFYLAMASLLISKINHRNDPKFESRIKYTISDVVYKNSGLKSYLNKLFHTDNKNIDIDFYNKRMLFLENYKIKKFIKQKWAPIFRKKINNTVPNKKLLRISNQGFDQIFKKIENHLTSKNINILYNSDIRQIDRNKNNYSIHFNGNTRSYDYIISTIPLTELNNCCFPNQNCDLTYLKLYSLFYEFHGTMNSNASIIMNYSPEGDWKRITIFKQSNSESSKLYFTVEGTLAPHKNGPENELVLEQQKQNFEQHISKSFLFKGIFKYKGGTITDYGYPLYTTTEINKAQNLINKVENFGIYTLGRQGRFNYLSSARVAQEATSFVNEFSKLLAEKG